MSRTRKIRVLSAVLFGAMLASGCSYTDPYQRSGTWKPSRVNDANIAAQIANPADLSRGRGLSGGNVRVATTPVERMWRGPAAAPPAGGSAAGGLAGQLGGARPDSEAPR